MKLNFSENFAKAQTKFFRFIADKFFARRYGHRAVVLETIAGVPGMVAGMWIHLKSLRQMRTGYGPMIRELLAEAENERMHLMFFIEIAQPNILERWLILAAQAMFWNYYLLLYVCSPKTAHLMVHYFEEEAVKSYTSYLEMVEDGLVENVPAPTLAIGYYGLGQDAKLSDLIKCVRADEQRHAIANAQFATDKPLKQANNLKRVHQVQEKTKLAPTQKQKDAA
ncbi:MAG: oxidase [Gammaproteobacteria bacterium]|jgi:ubiquinol oxidase|nr:oxidase [Gammaproteobacteria bacterium]